MLKKFFIKIININFYITGLIIFGSIVELSNLNFSITGNSERVHKAFKIISKPSKELTRQILIFRNKKLSNLKDLMHPTFPLIIQQDLSRFKNEKEGFTFNYSPNEIKDIGYLLLSRIDPESGDPSISIWDLNKQKMLYKYPIDKKKIVDFFKIDKRGQESLVIVHPTILSDGSFIANLVPYEGNNPKPLVRFNKCGELEAFNKQYEFHHSVEIDKNSIIYANIYSNRKYKKNYQLDGFALLDKNLKIINLHFLKDIFEDNKILKHALTNNSNMLDPFHINDVHPFYDKETNEKHVFLSLRNFGLLLFNLDKNELIWSMNGAAEYQHDITPLSEKGDEVSIFNNGSPISNLYNNDFENSLLTISNLPTKQINGYPSYYSGKNLNSYGLHMKEYKLDFLPRDLKPKTKNQGRGKISKDKKYLFMEETDAGRLLEVDLENKKLLWSFLNKKNINSPRFVTTWSRKLENLPFDLKTINFQECKKKRT